MAYKVCPKCKVHNAPGNSSCIKCGKALVREMIHDENAHKPLKLRALNQTFSSVLVAGAVVAIFFALMVALKQDPWLLLNLN